MLINHGFGIFLDIRFRNTNTCWGVNVNEFPWGIMPMAQAKNGAMQDPERAALITCLNLVVPQKFYKCAYIVSAADKDGQRLRLDGRVDYHADYTVLLGNFTKAIPPYSSEASHKHTIWAALRNTKCGRARWLISVLIHFGNFEQPPIYGTRLMWPRFKVKMPSWYVSFWNSLMLSLVRLTTPWTALFIGEFLRSQGHRRQGT